MSAEKPTIKSKEQRYFSRPHHKEEKEKQKRDWQKRCKKEKIKERRKQRGKQDQEPEPVQPEVNEPVIESKKGKDTDDVRAISHSVSLPCLETPTKKRKIEIKEVVNRDNIPKSSITKCSRGQKMVPMALKRTELSATNKIRTVLESRGLPREKVDKAPSRRSEKTLQIAGQREIDPFFVKKISDEPIGSGTFGNVFLAEYRGMKVAVKEMKGKDGSNKETEHCRQEVLHEANILMNLGDHPNLPFLFGICTKHQPFSIVLQFHGTGNKSLTLHKVLRNKLMNMKRTATVFKELAETLHYIHNKGLLHNDLKTNKVIMHCGEQGNFFRSSLTLENQNIRGMYRDIRGQQTTTTLHRKSNQARQKAPQVTFFGEGSCWTQLLPFIFKYSFKHNFIDPFGEKLCCCSVSVTREITQFWKCKTGGGGYSL